MWLRRQSYRTGLLRQKKLPVPVIVVGNLSVGGTGKTPLVIAIVEFLVGRGWNPGVIARGYGGQSDSWPRVLAASDSAEQVGDEPLMVLRRTGIPVIAGPDRVANAKMLVEQFDRNIVVSDDGFQHLRIARDIDIVVIDGNRRFGNGWCLPAGPLREFKSCLRWADIQVVNSAASQNQNEYEMTIETDHLYRLNAPEITRAPGDLRGRQIYAMAGLGNPQRFFGALQQMGLDFVAHNFPDHHIYTRRDFAFLKGDDVAIVTEKDAVKCDVIDIDAEVWVLPITAKLDAAFYDDLESRLTSLPVSPKGHIP